jgi:hypothetical protein
MWEPDFRVSGGANDALAQQAHDPNGFDPAE